MDQPLNRNIKLMGTTRRHSQILSKFDAIFVEQDLRNEIFSAREQIALVKNKGKLIDVGNLDKTQQTVVYNSMNQLKITYPDFMIFKKNPFIINLNMTRLAGIPDLIVEVWSPFNTPGEKEEKRQLYITDKSEFWEIDQNSIKFICWKADGTSYEQYLDRPVLTPWEEALDLSSLARDARDVEPNDVYHGGDDEGIDLDL